VSEEPSVHGTQLSADLALVVDGLSRKSAAIHATALPTPLLSRFTSARRGGRIGDTGGADDDDEDDDVELDDVGEEDEHVAGGFRDITFAVRRGEALALLGDRASGRDTLLRVLAV
jgi:hypothetical protein